MKPFGKLLVAVVLLLVVGGSFGAYGLFWVTSNTVHVDIQYTVVLSISVLHSRVLLTATVTNNGKPAGAGVSVDFYYSLNGGEWTHFTTQETNRVGIARTRYTITANGAYNFRAAVRLP